MSSFTFDELRAAARNAIRIKDVDSLAKCAREFEMIGTPESRAFAANARGTVERMLGNYSVARSEHQAALLGFKMLNNSLGVAAALVNLGILHYNASEYESALENYKRALLEMEKTGDRIAIADINNNIGNVYSDIGDYPQALLHLHFALALYQEAADARGIGSVNGNIGNVHLHTSNFPAALEHYHRSLSSHEEQGDRRSAAHVLGSIASVSVNIGDHQGALQYYERALAISQEQKDIRQVALTTGNIGHVQLALGDHVSALEYFTSALAIYEELQENKGIAQNLIGLLGVYIALGSDAEATTTLARADSIRIDQPDFLIQRELFRAELQMRRSDLNAALVTMQAALTTAQQRGVRIFEASVHKALRDLSQLRGDFAGYIEHNNEFVRITEEVSGKDTTMKIAVQTMQRNIDAKEKEHLRHLAVLHSTLPKHIADRVARGEVVNDHYDNASVIFLDIVGFTDLSSSMSSQDVIALLDNIFTQCDAICEKYNVTKIKTIGDSYMAVAFETANTEQRTANVMPSEVEAQRTASSVVRASSAAIEMMNVTLNEELTKALEKALEKALNKPIIEFRIGIHCGPVTAGVIGTQRMQYDVWGDTVNVASRMESTSEPGKIHVSEALANALNEAHIVPRGEIEIKGKGMMKTYWLERQ